MGTNYYLHRDQKCPTCGHVKEPMHIGKASDGNAFELRVYEVNRGPRSLESWVLELSYYGRYIRDEYGRIIELDRMLVLILSGEGKTSLTPYELVNREFS